MANNFVFLTSVLFISAALAGTASKAQESTADERDLVEIAIARSKAHLAREEFAAARDLLTRALHEQPQVGSLYYWRGIAFAESGMRRKAIFDFTEAIQRRHPKAQSHAERGWLYMQLGATHDALDDFSTAIRIDSLNARARYGRYLLFQKLDMEKEAEDERRFIVTRIPTHPFAFLYRGTSLLADGKHTAAIDQFTHAVTADPSFAPAYYSRANAYLEVADYEAAINDLERVVKLQPKNVLYHATLAGAYLQGKKRGHWEPMRAFEAAQKTIALSNGNAGLSLIAQIYAAMGDYEQAVAWQEKAIVQLRSEGGFSVEVLRLAREDLEKYQRLLRKGTKVSAQPCR